MGSRCKHDPPPFCNVTSHCTPASPYDWTLLGITIAAAVPFIYANGVVFRFRKRKYFQAQGGADLILASSAAGLIWIAASFVTNDHFHRKHFLSICTLWSFWLQLTFGFCTWLVCLSLRLYRLYSLCTRRELPNLLQTWAVYIPVLLVPGFIYSMVASFEKAIDFCPQSELGLANCFYRPEWMFVTFFVLLPLYFSMVVFLLYHLRGQKDYMLHNEYLHTSDYSMMTFMVYLLIGVTYLSKRQYSVYGRCFLTFCVCVLVFSHFWVRMGWPVYLCLFRSKLEMDNFENELRWCGAECFDNLEMLAIFRHFGGLSLSIPASQLHDNDWIVRAIDAAMVEASELKAKIEQLEQKRSRINAKIKELLQQPGSSTLPSPLGNARNTHLELS